MKQRWKMIRKIGGWLNLQTIWDLGMKQERHSQWKVHKCIILYCAIQINSAGTVTNDASAEILSRHFKNIPWHTKKIQQFITRGRLQPIHSLKEIGPWQTIFMSLLSHVCLNLKFWTIPIGTRAIHDSDSPVGVGRLSRQKAHKLRAPSSNSSVSHRSMWIRVWISDRTQVTCHPFVTWLAGG